MILELIPVIEIGYNNQGIEAPDKYPYWEHPELWDNYNKESYIKAGFKDELIPYLPGSSFYRLTDISDNNLIKLLMDHTEAMRNGGEVTVPFFGGFVLRMHCQDKYYPQCCGDLSDIIYWEKLLVDKKQFFYQGHPQPVVIIKDHTVIFDFTVDEFDERFVPPPPDIRIEFNKSDLYDAIGKVKPELKAFGERLTIINLEQGLNILNIDKLLIWGEDYDGDI